MCFRTVRWAHGVTGLTPVVRLVLLDLALFANHKTGIAYPGIDCLAKTTGLSRRAVLAAVRQLRDAGLISVERPDGVTRITNYYRFPLAGGEGAPHAPPHAGDAPSPVQEVHPNLEEELPLPPGWTPNSDDVAELQRRYPELDINASTDRFIAHHAGTGKTNRNWDRRFKAWAAEDGSDPKRTKRTATRASRPERIGAANRRRVGTALARLAALPNDPAGGDGS
jgi:DNA-binding transcriptional ArsR family regulator